MIFLQELVGTEGNGLSLQNKTLTINQSNKDFICVDCDLKIVIASGVQAKLMDMSNNAKIEIEVKEDAFLTYHILNSKNTLRTIFCFGEASIMEICLEQSQEELSIYLLKENASIFVEALCLAKENTINLIQKVEHQAKHTSSNISNFGVALQKGAILFDTTGKINKGMAKSKCVQLSKGIVMDDVSMVTSKPILLIDEYDVIANHGASIGKMSDESLFYLMSRGLTKQESFLLILEGIVHPFMEKIEDESLKAQFSQKLKTIMKR